MRKLLQSVIGSPCGLRALLSENSDTFAGDEERYFCWSKFFFFCSCDATASFVLFYFIFFSPHWNLFFFPIWNLFFSIWNLFFSPIEIFFFSPTIEIFFFFSPYWNDFLPIWATWIMLTSLAPSPIASVIAFLFCLTSWTICAFCKGVTRQQTMEQLWRVSNFIIFCLYFVDKSDSTDLDITNKIFLHWFATKKKKNKKKFIFTFHQQFSTTFEDILKLHKPMLFHQ